MNFANSPYKKVVTGYRLDDLIQCSKLMMIRLWSIHLRRRHLDWKIS